MQVGKLHWGQMCNSIEEVTAPEVILAWKETAW